MFKLIELISAFFAWLQLLTAPTMIACIIGLLIYQFKQDNTGKAIAVTITLLGFVLGVLWASKLWRKTGTRDFRLKSGRFRGYEKEENLE